VSYALYHEAQPKPKSKVDHQAPENEANGEQVRKRRRQEEGNGQHAGENGLDTVANGHPSGGVRAAPRQYVLATWKISSNT